MNRQELLERLRNTPYDVKVSAIEGYPGLHWVASEDIEKYQKWNRFFSQLIEDHLTEFEEPYAD